MLPIVDIRKFIGRQCRLKGKPLVQVKCSFEYREVIIRIGCHKDKRLADSPALENTIRRKKYDAGCRGGVKKEQKESEKYIKVQKSATIVLDFTFTKHSACLML